MFNGRAGAIPADTASQSNQLRRSFTRSQSNNPKRKPPSKPPSNKVRSPSPTVTRLNSAPLQVEEGRRRRRENRDLRRPEWRADPGRAQQDPGRCSCNWPARHRAEKLVMTPRESKTRTTSPRRSRRCATSSMPARGRASGPRANSPGLRCWCGQSRRSLRSRSRRSRRAGRNVRCGQGAAQGQREGQGRDRTPRGGEAG